MVAEIGWRNILTKILFIIKRKWNVSYNSHIQT